MTANSIELNSEDLIKLYSLVSEDLLKEKARGVEDPEDYKHSVGLRKKLSAALKKMDFDLWCVANEFYNQFGI